MQLILVAFVASELSVQVIPGVNGTATTEQILDAVLSSKGFSFW